MKSPRKNVGNQNREHRVLVIDDDMAVCDVFAEYLYDDGIETHKCQFAEDAAQMMSQTKYSLIIVDIVLPGMSGREFIRSTHNKFPDVKIISLSGTDSYGDIFDCYDGGADYFIPKPVDLDYARVVIHRALENRDFFKKNWAAIRQKWIASPPKHKMLLERNIIQNIDNFVSGCSVDDSTPGRQELLTNLLKELLPSSQTLAAALRSVVPHLPDDIEDRAAWLAAMHYAYREELASLLQPIVSTRINQSIQGRDSIESKQNTAKQINEELKHYGLTIRCEVRDPQNPNIVTVYPSFLVADTPRSSNRVGRLRLEYQDETGKMKRQALPSEASSIGLMVARTEENLDPTITDPATFVGRIAQQVARRRENR